MEYGYRKIVSIFPRIYSVPDFHGGLLRFYDALKNALWLSDLRYVEAKARKLWLHVSLPRLYSRF